MVATSCFEVYYGDIGWEYLCSEYEKEKERVRKLMEEATGRKIESVKAERYEFVYEDFFVWANVLRVKVDGIEIVYVISSHPDFDERKLGPESRVIKCEDDEFEDEEFLAIAEEEVGTKLPIHPHKAWKWYDEFKLKESWKDWK